MKVAVAVPVLKEDELAVILLQCGHALNGLRHPDARVGPQRLQLFNLRGKCAGILTKLFSNQIAKLGLKVQVFWTLFGVEADHGKLGDCFHAVCFF